jgi:hypothetical protein
MSLAGQIRAKVSFRKPDTIKKKGSQEGGKPLATLDADKKREVRREKRAATLPHRDPSKSQPHPSTELRRLILQPLRGIYREIFFDTSASLPLCERRYWFQSLGGHPAAVLVAGRPKSNGRARRCLLRAYKQAYLWETNASGFLIMVYENNAMVGR